MSGFTAEKNLRAVVSGLRGQRLADVVYYPLASEEDDGWVTEQWDFGDWHEPTMGVELTTDVGHRYSAIWNNAFTCYGLEVFRQPMTDFVRIGPSWGAVAVSDHPRWAGLIGQKLIHVDTCWDTDPFGTVRVPTAVRLGTRAAEVWIAVGRPAEPGPTDDIPPRHRRRHGRLHIRNGHTSGHPRMQLRPARNRTRPATTETHQSTSLDNRSTLKWGQFKPS